MPALFTAKTPLQTMLDHNTYTRSRLGGNTHTVVFVADFDGLHVLWCTVNQQGIDLECAVQQAQAKIVEADDHLDDFVTKHAAAIQAATKNNREHPLFKLFYGSKSPSEFAKPILGKQLSAMKPWVAALQSSTYPTLPLLAGELGPLLDAADSAIGALATAKSNLDIFTTVGARKDLVDKFNAVRQSTYGKIAEMVHQNPPLMLPPRFADRFFKPYFETKGAKTLKDLQAKLKSLQDEVTDTQKAIDDLQAEANKAATNEAHLADLQKQLADAQQNQDASASKVADLEAQIAETQKKLKK